MIQIFGLPLWEVLALILVASMLLRIVSMIRRKARSQKDEPPQQFDFTVGELQQLLQSGQLTPEEFERAMASVMSRSAKLPDNGRVKGFPVIPSKPPNNPPS